MGRVSKRRAASEVTNVITMPKKIIKVGIYARLSSDADKKKNESIDVQVDIARAFIEDFNEAHVEQMEVFDVYQDLGKTGTNFNRDEFSRLMQDIRLRDVNCVIVKDLSRFGRNYLEAGNYIEKIFPFLGVRFIAVADGLDTGNNGNQTGNMATEIKNLVNDMYAKDFSVKAKIHLKQRREEGSYVGGPAPYGYECIWKNKIRKLVPNEDTAAIVKLIFAMMIKEKNYATVTDELNQRRINPPMIYKKTKQVICPDREEYRGWDKTTVQRMMKSPIYMGNLEQGKTTITGKCEANRQHKNKDEWVIKENTHEPLISIEEFDTVQQIMKDIFKSNKNRNHKADLLPLEENIFDSVLFCGVCGRKMTRHSAVTPYADGRIERVESYSCLDSINSKVDKCKESNRITKRALTDILVPALRLEFAVYLDKPKKYTEYGRKLVEEAGQRYEKKLRELQMELDRIHEEESDAYMEYRLGDLKQSNYVELKMKNVDKKQSISNQIEEIKTCQMSLSKVSEKFTAAIRALLRMKSGKELTKDLIEALIERINVYPGKRIEIVYRYSDELLKGVK
ncbi:MAG: recombinase family protein [Lachnospira sp.]|nr:recombinase family protein [Lachnospira sp.]